MRFGRYATVCLIAALAATPGVALAEEALTAASTSTLEYAGELEQVVNVSVSDADAVLATEDIEDTQVDSQPMEQADELSGSLHAVSEPIENVSGGGHSMTTRL